jgi:hypothetical protein
MRTETPLTRVPNPPLKGWSGNELGHDSWAARVKYPLKLAAGAPNWTSSDQMTDPSQSAQRLVLHQDSERKTGHIWHRLLMI